MLTAIAAARSSVRLESYILRNDATGQRFRETLRERARAGVSVQLLYDAWGSMEVADAAYAPLRQVGAQVRAYNPIMKPGLPLRRRDHRKLLLVDGAVGFVGGLNIGDEYYYGPGPASHAWRDLHARVEGPAVAALDSVFREGWQRSAGESLEPAPVARPAGTTRCAVVSDGPEQPRRRTRALLRELLGRSRHAVRLATPYFVPGRKTLRALLHTAGRGVRVELLVAGRSDHPLLLHAARSLFPQLLSAGVHVFEYRRTMLHAKLSVFDDRLAIVGTSNLDRQSLLHNLEVNLLLDDPESVRALAAAHAQDCAESVRVEVADLAARGPAERCFDRALGGLARRL